MTRRGTRTDKTVQGILIILASVCMMSFNDAMVKLVSSDLTVWQVFFARSLFAIPVLLLICRLAKVSFTLKAPKWVLFRSVLLILSWIVFYASLPVLSLSVAAVAMYTNPIFTALLSALIIGEPVSKRQWVGVLLGFLGVLVILKPGTDAFSWFTLLPLLGAALYSSAMILTRSKCQDEAPLNLALNLHVAFFVTGLLVSALLFLFGLEAATKNSFPFLFGDWFSMALEHWGLMAFLGVLSAVFFVGVARAYQIAPPSIIGTFDYGYLVSAVIWGLVFFSEKPDLLTISGMILITVAGFLVAISKGVNQHQERDAM